MLSFDLLSLPEELSRTALVHWLTLRSLLQLDSAFCNVTQRPRFLSLVNGQGCIYTVPFKRKTADILRWSIARNTEVNGVDIDSLALHDHATRAKFLAVNHSSLRWISNCKEHENNNSAVVLLEVAKICHNILKLDIVCNAIRSKPYPLGSAMLELVKGNQLTSLKLDSKISQSALMQILERCNSLTHLIILHARPFQDTVLPPAAAIPTLTYLRTDCLISDATLVAIGGTCSQLRSLLVHDDLHPARNPVTDVGVAAVLQGCVLLRHTNLYIKTRKTALPPIAGKLADI
jgi:hypothetical protein